MCFVRSQFLVMSLLFLGSEYSLKAQEMTIEEYRPRKTLVVPENPLTSSRFSFCGYPRTPKGCKHDARGRRISRQRNGRAKYGGNGKPVRGFWRCANHWIG